MHWQETILGRYSQSTPNIQVARTTEYSFGIQREIGFRTAIELRYVGARGDGLVRATDMNQVDILNNGFLADFNRARQNLILSGNVRSMKRALLPVCGARSFLRNHQAYASGAKNTEPGAVATGSRHSRLNEPIVLRQEILR